MPGICCYDLDNFSVAVDYCDVQFVNTYKNTPKIICKTIRAYNCIIFFLFTSINEKVYPIRLQKTLKCSMVNANLQKQKNGIGIFFADK